MGRDGWRVRVGLRVAAVAAVSAVLAVPAAGQSTIVLDIDVASFSERAAAWSAASKERRAADLARAIELGRQAAAAEADRRTREQAAAGPTLVTSTTIPAPTTTVAATPTTASITAVLSDASMASPTAISPSGGPSAEQWASLRDCESGGRYDAVSPSGQHRGAYQFSQPTWDWVASFANPSLMGVDPIAASAEDQDAQAQALFDRQGAVPWPHCGIYLSS